VIDRSRPESFVSHVKAANLVRLAVEIERGRFGVRPEAGRAELNPDCWTRSDRSTPRTGAECH
jgi:hypothetical protein